MARRDRIPLTTPIPQSTLKGLRIDRMIHIDMETGLMGGSISFYEAGTGRFVKSVYFSDIGNGGDFQLSAAQVEQVAALVTNRLQARDPSLAGVRVVETVPDSNDPVPNP
jgi:hypothetical protein